MSHTLINYLCKIDLVSRYLSLLWWQSILKGSVDQKHAKTNKIWRQNSKIHSAFACSLLASMTSRSLQTVWCMREAWKQETYVRCQSFSSESAVKYLNLEQRKIQIYLPLGEHDQSHAQFVFAIPNNSHKFQSQFPPNFQLLGIARNSEKIPTGVFTYS